MAKFGQILYGTDTYGERVRGDIELTLTNTGTWQDDAGRLFAKFVLKIGALDATLPEGTRLVVARGTSWYPDIPGRFGDVPDMTEGLVPNSQSVILADTLEKRTKDGVEYLHIPGSVVLTEKDLPPVPINSVLYIRAFVREPAEGAILPWDIRGSVFAVMAGNYGGIGAAVQALPSTMYSGGDPFALPDADSVTFKFMSTIGFLADTITTDGSLMIDGPTRLHPNMVMPLLTSFGMTQRERAAFSDPIISARLKNFLYAYRRLQASKGTAAALGELCRVLTGYEVDVLPTVENMLVTLGDSSPAGVVLDVTGDAVACGFEVRSASHAAVCTLPWSNGVPIWGDLWATAQATNVWDDTWEDVLEDGSVDLWLDRWDQFDIPSSIDLPDRVIGDAADDLWAVEPGEYEQHVDWVHALTLDRASVSMGTKTHNGVPLLAYSQPIAGRPWVRLRMRVGGSPGISATPEVIFLNAAGKQLLRSAGAAGTTSSGWIDLTMDVRAPSGTAAVAWNVRATGAKDKVLFVGAIELRDVSLVGANAVVGVTMNDSVEFDADDVDLDQQNIPGPQTAWLNPYRNPRSIVVAVHTPWSFFDPIGWQFDGSPEPLADDETSLMDQRTGEGVAAVLATDRLLVRKVEVLMPDCLPHSVTARILPSWNEEYELRFPDRKPTSAARAAVGSKSLLNELPAIE